MSRLKAHHQQTLTPAGDETVKPIRQTRQATVKRYSAEEKLRIVMEGLRGEEPISAICRREGIHANLYYRWLKEFMEAGKARLKGEETRGASRELVAMSPPSWHMPIDTRISPAVSRPASLSPRTGSR